ncbi:MAG: hypothetical protein IJ464_02925 [Alistipes sp.]|nr:hypothetical protein [Alistipes sp.]
MKKLLSILAMALCFVACQNDGVENVSNSDLVDVVLTVDAPELGITRADGDLFKGKSSAYGAIDFMNDADWEGYDLRYILEVYAEDDTNGANGMIYSERLVNCLDKYAETTFALRLVPGRTYKFVVFADFVAEGNAERTEPADKLAIADLYYNTADLRNISAITTEQTWGAMNEVRDAYFVSENVEITTNLTKKLTLTRPFAKLRVITTDLSYIKGYTAPGYVEITYKNEPIYKSFNAVNGELNTDSIMTGAELTYGYEVSKTTPYTDGYDSNPTNQTLFTDYLLAVDDEQTPVNFEMTVYESKGGRKIYSHDFNTQIPIERNHLTTIVGDLLTTQANITIEINDNFDEKEYVIGWGDENNIVIEENKWGNGEYVDGKYQFLVEAEGDEFTVNVNAAAVKNGALDTATYIWADDAQEGTTHTFSVEGLKANETTRALVDVEVLGGRMHVQSMDNNYKVLLNLVVKFSETDIRNTVYEYNGPITFGKILEAPAVTAVAEGNTVTVNWTKVEGATSYFVAMGDAEAEETQELSKVYTDLAWETEYTFSVKAVADGVESVAATATATTEAEPKPEARTITVYSRNTEVEQVYIYTWAEDGTLLTGEWPGTAMTVAAEQTEPNCKTFTYIFGAEYDGKVVNFIFNNGQGGEGNQTEDLKGKVLTEDLTFDVTLNAVAVQPEPEPTDAPEYQVAIPEGYTSVIFVRMNPASTENNWNEDTNKWNQTADLVIPTDGNTWYTVAEGAWDQGDGAWSNFASAQNGYLYFTPNTNWKVNNARFAAYFFGNGEKWVDLEPYTPAVEPEPEPTTPTIAEVLKSEDGAAVKTGGTVMAICTKGYILSDGEATIYVYTASEPTVAVGNNITVSGTFANYYGTLQIASPVVEENDNSTLVPTYPTPVDLTSQADYDAYQTFGTDAPTNYPFVKIKGTLSSARYITVGTSEKQSMFNYSVNDYTAMNDLEVTTTAYIIGYHSTKGYYQLIETSVEAAPYISASNKSVNADVTEASIEVSSNVTWNVTCDAEWVTSYTQSGNSNGTIDIVMSANELTEARSATFIISAGDVKETVTLTQNAKAGQPSEDVNELAFTKDNRTTFDASTQAVYEANGIKLTNNKGSYNNNLGDYNEPARFYQGTEIIIEAPGNISSIVFDCNTGKPTTGLTNSFETGVTYTTEGNIVTVTLDGSSNTFTIASANAQFRLNKITVTYAK